MKRLTSLAGLAIATLLIPSIVNAASSGQGTPMVMAPTTGQAADTAIGSSSSLDLSVPAPSSTSSGGMQMDSMDKSGMGGMMSMMSSMMGSMMGGMSGGSAASGASMSSSQAPATSLSQMTLQQLMMFVTQLSSQVMMLQSQLVANRTLDAPTAAALTQMAYTLGQMASVLSQAVQAPQPPATMNSVPGSSMGGMNMM